jgi:hypothetical protein
VHEHPKGSRAVGCSSWRRLIVGFAALVAFGFACSSHAAASSPALGVYRAAIGPNVLTLRGDTWRMRSGIRVKSGVFHLDGDRIVFLHRTANNPAYAGAYCRGARDTYQWSVDDDTLMFRVKGRVCDQNLFAVLTVAGPWRLAR